MCTKYKVQHESGAALDFRVIKTGVRWGGSHYKVPEPIVWRGPWPGC